MPFTHLCMGTSECAEEQMMWGQYLIYIHSMTNEKKHPFVDFGTFSAFRTCWDGITINTQCRLPIYVF